MTKTIDDLLIEMESKGLMPNGFYKEVTGTWEVSIRNKCGVVSRSEGETMKGAMIKALRKAPTQALDDPNDGYPGREFRIDKSKVVRKRVRL
jgi:hypothetical protein